jgi:putative membrane protein
MPLMRLGWFALALVVLALAWLGPLPELARHSFAAHMTMHIAVVAIAAPLIALAIAGGPADLVRVMPRVVSPIPASMIELLIVWGWHLPALHHAARQSLAIFVLEQVTFAAAGVLLWTAAIGGGREQRRLRAGGGIVALLFTSMHMTLLGALFAVSDRPLFPHPTSHSTPEALADQQLGGVIMLLVGSASYLIGGLGLTAAALRQQTVPPVRAQESTI